MFRERKIPSGRRRQRQAAYALLFTFLYRFDIPWLDAHLREHDGAQFEQYARTSKRLIPFVL